MLGNESMTEPVQQLSVGEDTVISKKRNHMFSLDLKKNYENMSEVLMLFTKDEQPLKSIFENTSAVVKYFPTSWDTLESMCAQQQPAGKFKSELVFDPDYENYLFENGGTLEQILDDSQRMMDK